MTPDQIIAMWKEGNLRFREGRKIQRDFLAEQKATASGQFPAGVLLTCIDSRAPAEILFNLGMGDVFNTRIAGNIENPDILGEQGHRCIGAHRPARAGLEPRQRFVRHEQMNTRPVVRSASCT